MKDKPYVTARIRGGLGNQLFMYAMARRLSLTNGVPLLLEMGAGFADDFYKRSFELDKFKIDAQRISLPPVSKANKSISIALNALLPFEFRRTYYDLSLDFDPRYLSLPVTRRIMLDGYWQDERYFSDIGTQLKADLIFMREHSEENEMLAAEMRACDAVAIHVRQLHGQPAGKQEVLSHIPHLPEDYYNFAIHKIKERIPNARFYVFSDKQDVSFAFFQRENVTRISNKGLDSTYEDLWLMSQCRHFVLANSTFSWWGAWLGRSSESIVISPLTTKWAPRTKLPKAWNAIEWP